MRSKLLSVLVFLLASHYVLIGTAQEQAISASRDHERLIVVAPRELHPALAAYLNFKQSIRPTELVELETILASSDEGDDPEKIKRWLYEQWSKRGVGYVLLVGDVSVMPVRYMVLDRVTPAAFDYAFYPSDLYYSDLARDDGSFDNWNASTDSFHAGYYGEVRGEKNKSEPINFDQVDYRPDLAVGRWPVETAAEVELLANKTIRFEKGIREAKATSRPRAAFVAVGGWVDSRPLMDDLSEAFGSKWEITKAYYGDRRRPSNLLPTPATTRELLDSGVRLLVHAGHGQPDAWEQCLSVADLDRIANSSELPVIVSAGCSTAYFAPLPPYTAYVDTEGNEHIGTDHGEQFTSPPPPPSPWQKKFNPSGLGEQILKRNAHGAVVYIGCNTGSQPCGLTLVEGFVSALAAADTPHVGQCWSAALRHYYDNQQLAQLQPDAGWYPPSVFFQGMKFMFFGDPSLPLIAEP